MNGPEELPPGKVASLSAGNTYVINSCCSIPYVAALSSRQYSLLSNIECLRVCLYPLLKVRGFFSMVKGGIAPLGEITKIVYELKCNACQASYIGLTSRYLSLCLCLST